MKLNQPITPEDYKLLNGFQSICKTLQKQQYAGRWEKPLVYWVLPGDRRVPMALLGHKIGDLLATSFDDLFNTPGVGRKKIETLVTLLQRVAQEDSPTLVTVGTEASGQNGNGKPSKGKKFNSADVSDAVWTLWQKTVRRHGLGCEKIGYLAPTLQTLPTVIWQTPLDFYLDRNLDEIRSLKTHGAKRVCAVLEVFHTLHHMLAKAGTDEYMVVRPAPKFVVALENWLARVMASETPPTAKELRRYLVLPLLEQIRHDGGETLHSLVRVRLGIDGKSKNIREQSKRMGVTRARVYQMLEDSSDVMNVRWPQGHCYLAHLSEKLTDKNALKMLNTLRDLLYAE